ncbi:MAG: DUF1016 family protein [Terrimonas sp.]|nr:DUF1016 family protein [Terrimonas sp.]
MSQKHFGEIAQIIRHTRKETLRTVEVAILYTYFNVGRTIKEEQKDKHTLPGDLLYKLSNELTKEHGKSYSVENLKAFKQFYLLYSGRFFDSDLQKISTAWSESLAEIPHYDSVITLFKKKFSLTWLHDQFLIKIENDKVRNQLEKEAVQNGWSIEKLKLKFPE